MSDHFLIITDENNERITFRRSTLHNDRIVTENKIMFIKMIRNLASCSLKDAKDFADMFEAKINDLQPDMIRIQNEIKSSITSIEDLDELRQIQKFVACYLPYH